MTPGREDRVNKTKVAIRDDLMVTLHQIGKREEKPLPLLVDELIHAGLERREENEAAKLECPV